jgi:glycosyltransferase involved in cell wall biosynthesis
MRPRVSAITAFLNEERYLAAAIESVLAQTYQGWELILVDDGSTDGSTGLAKQYALRFPEKIRYLEHESHRNCGLPASRNVGLAQAEGDYVAFLDGDDIWLTDKLERQVALLDSQPEVGWVVGGTLYLYENGLRIPQALALDPGTIARGALIPRMLESDDNAPCTCSVLLRKILADQVGGFEEDFRVFEDQVMWAKCSLGAQILFDPCPVSVYRVHAASMCNSTPRSEQLASRMRMQVWLLQALTNAGASVSRNLVAVARARLRASFVEIAGSNGGAPNRDDRLSLVYRSRMLRLFQAHRHALGPGLSALILADVVCGPRAWRVSRRLFDYFAAATDGGWVAGLRAFARNVCRMLVRRAGWSARKRSARSGEG